MGWMDRAREYSGEEYSSPAVAEHQLDEGGNYVSPARASGDVDKPSAGGVIVPLGSSPAL